MNLRGCSLLFLSIALFGSTVFSASASAQKDYLSAVEADKIRDAESTNERIHLFLSFAEDRLKKFQ